MVLSQSDITNTSSLPFSDAPVANKWLLDKKCEKDYNAKENDHQKATFKVSTVAIQACQIDLFGREFH
jgi:hypothetical protein